MWTRTHKALPLVLAALLMAGAGCIFSPDEDNEGPPPPPKPQIPPPTSAQNLIDALEVIYNDQVRNAIERRDEYQNLFPPPSNPENPETDPLIPSFIFRLQPDDVVAGLPESWGLDQEVAIHERMFAAQEAREIFSLTLSIDNLPPEPLEFPDPGQEDWLVVAATNINLRLLFNPDDGLEVVGGQADYFAAPASDLRTTPASDRWFLVEWVDRPRQGG